MARVALYPSSEDFKRLYKLLGDSGLDEKPFEELLQDVVDDVFETTKLLYDIDEED